MDRIPNYIDSLNTWVGKAFAWCIVILTFSTLYEVVVRYAFNAPTTWAFDMSVQMYGALFMMTGAYALGQGAHVRGDVVYRLLPLRVQASIDMTLYILFLIPGMLALIFYGYGFAEDSWFYREVSWNSPARIQIYFFKSLIPIAGFLVLLQGIAEIIRCVHCIKHGSWPVRLHDVEETDAVLIREAAELREQEEFRKAREAK